MRISLAELLLLPVALVLGLIISAELCRAPRETVSYTFTAAADGAKRIRLICCMDDHVSPVGEINRWLMGQPVRRLDPWNGMAERDPWGNAYVCVERDLVQQDDCGIHIFSKGADGISKTNGNDLDDISTWSERPTEFYWKEVQRDRDADFVRKLVLSLLWTTPASFAGFVFVNRVVRSKWKKKCRTNG